MHAKVIIVGGGVAGVVAAKTLAESGVRDFLILEAGEDLGGRLRTIKSPNGVTLEMGACWIHGTEGNPIYFYSEKYKTRRFVTDMNNYTVRNTQGRIVTPTAKEVHENLKKAQGFTRQICHLKKSADHEVDVTQRAALTMAGWQPKEEVEKTIEFLFYDFMYAIPPELLSLKASDDFDGRNMEYGDVRVVGEGGYTAILKKIASEFLSHNDARIRLGELVTHISQSQSHVEVKTEGDRVYTCQFVIFTCSIGVLQAGNIKFSPPLSQTRIDALNASPMNNYKKVFLGFPYKFWDDTEFILFATNKHGHFQVWENLCFLGKPILAATLIGEEADRTDHLSNSELQEEAIAVLKQMYGQGVPTPQWCITTHWGLDPLFYGSYSTRPLGFTNKELATINTPHGHVYFAGDGYSKDSYGEVLGAYETGVEAARQVVSQMAQSNAVLFVSKL